MLFSSYVFVFAFLPLVLLGDAVLSGRAPTNVRHGWLLCCSLFFYAYWNSIYLILI